jgi:hypothetical protein
MHAVRDCGIIVFQPQEEWEHDENSILVAANSGSTRRQCGFACHTIVKEKDYVLTEYPKR